MNASILLLLPLVLPVTAAFLQRYWPYAASHRNAFAGASMLLTSIAGILCLLVCDTGLTLWRLTDTIAVSFSLDGVSRLYLALLAVVWPLVGLYAMEYLEHDENPGRFFLFYLISYGVLNALSMADNLITLYMFYEMMTLVTLPLVLHNMDREAVAAAIKYLIYSVFGASAALLGIFFVGAYGNGFNFVAGGMMNTEALAGHEGLARAVFFVMIAGFGVKAGMFPMHNWLPTAHPVAPAPASAVLSGVITKMGVLGVIRVIYYVAGASMLRGTWVQYAFMALTLVTVVMGSTMAFQEKQLKKRLAYSTVSQVSYVLFGLSTMTRAGFVGAVLHIVFHSLIKNTLFMSAGAVIHKTGKTMVADLRGIGKAMPATMWMFTVVSMGLIGIPPTGGFISKWHLAQGAFAAGSAAGWIGASSLLISAILTAAYLMVVSIRAFFPGETCEAPNEKCEVGIKMMLPMAVFSALVVIGGMFPNALIHFAGEIAALIL